MAHGGTSEGDTGGRRRGPRSGSNDPLMQEVRWRLFRREDLPARLRRLERLEEIAMQERGGEQEGEEADSP